MALTGWEPLLDRYTIYRIGRRQYPVGTTFREMADDVITAIEGLRPPVDLMGASTGGIIALEIAAARPDLVRRLVLVITGSTVSPVARDLGERVIAAARAGKWRRRLRAVAADRRSIRARAALLSSVRVVAWPGTRRGARAIRRS